jgi:hypothetical protein
MGIEDGVALGIALCGVVGSPEERLSLFQTMRRPLVNLIQLMDKLATGDKHTVGHLPTFAEKLGQFVAKEPGKSHARLGSTLPARQNG